MFWTCVSCLAHYVCSKSRVAGMNTAPRVKYVLGKDSQETHREGGDESNLLVRGQLQLQQAGYRQRQDHHVGHQVHDAVEAKDGLLVPAVPTGQAEVPVVLDRLADEERAQDAGDGEEGDADGGDLADEGQLRDREDLDVEEQQRDLGQAEAEGPEDLKG